MSSQDVNLPELEATESLPKRSAKLCRFAAEKSIGMERAVEEVLRDMRLFKFSPSTLYKIAMGEFSEDEELDWTDRNPGNAPAHYWSYTEIGRRAAAKLLAEEDDWDLEIAARHAKTGYQRFLRSNPILRNVATSYEGGPLGGLAEKQFNYSGLGFTINGMTLNDFRNISLDFLRMILPDSEFAKENSMVAGFSWLRLSQRKDLLSKGMGQLDKTRRKLLKKIIAAGEKEQVTRKA